MMVVGRFAPGVRIATNWLRALSEVTFLNEILKSKYKLDTTIQSIWALPRREAERYSIYIKKMLAHLVLLTGVRYYASARIWHL